MARSSGNYGCTRGFKLGNWENRDQCDRGLLPQLVLTAVTLD